MVSVQTLAGVLAERGKTDEAEPLFREALATGKEMLGEGHLLTLSAHGAYAMFLEDGGRMDEAQRLREDEAAIAERQYGERHPGVARALEGLGRHFLARGQPAEAEPHFRRALAVRQRLHPAGHWRIAAANAMVGRCLVEARRPREAEPFLRAGYEGLRNSPESRSDVTRATLARLIDVLEASGRAEEAARYRADQSAPEAAQARR